MLPKSSAPTKELTFEGHNDRWLQIGSAQKGDSTKPTTTKKEKSSLGLLSKVEGLG